jgi:Cu(I)/Ag(I) efflux system membrane fusion protein
MEIKLVVKPGMQAVTKLTQSNRKGLFIPIDAVIREENHKYILKKGLFENVMVETGVANGIIKSEMDSSKVVVTGAYAINSEYIFRKGSDPMAGMKCKGNKVAHENDNK